MATTRLETFCDGVIAIAATLLILDVRATGHHLGSQLTHIWPSYAAYAISFLTIGIIWVNHHTVMSVIGSVDRRFLFVNVLFLMTVAFAPFPTRLVAEYVREGGSDARDAALAYGFTFTAMAISFGLMWFYAIGGGRLLRADADPKLVAGISRSFRPGWLMYLSATLIAFASPAASVALFAAIALLYVLESSVFASVRGRS
jgi:uncharacterized membrane protein